ncbi:5,10-methylenetetrahydrofolate reductase [Oleiphilus messinensis]|uniref:5,10-methylenetetrahydrofolate reductase n=1 Tax=Oleiphilus messinensis TaxID=141451 RepID=A0A1Y0IFG6_9GAMM|nr:methylenetetrahydrofolate reductase [Oleiphilus messinensis]ARU59267.1 5,10-methylenetetrahydrofolate reductase [Oleiphilus messinensis]
MLRNKILNREDGIVFYGIVPPKKDTDPERVREISELQMSRLKGRSIDGMVLYDIQDESSRTSEKRPFPFMETLDSFRYSREYLSALDVPKIIYRSVGKYTKDTLSQFIQAVDTEKELSVFVGASSMDQDVTMTMREAYALRSQLNPELLVGGVTIPERHLTKLDEHMRVFSKMQQGCSFFVSQGVYDVNASKNFLSDYYFYGQENGIELAPIIFTLTPCGSRKTLEFMKWLGIEIPRWLENELVHSEDILQKSVEFSVQSYKELRAYAAEKNIPIGCNIESVAVRKAEVEASIEMLDMINAG